MRNRLFVSYSKKDTGWLKKLQTVFAPEIRNDRIDYWDDHNLLPGDAWYEEIVNAIQAAKVAVLLVSPHFFQSRFIMEEELPRILKAAAEGLKIVWIPVSGDYSEKDMLREAGAILDVQAAFDPRKPLDRQEAEEQSISLLRVCRYVSGILGNKRIISNIPFSSLGFLFKGRDAEMTHTELELGDPALTENLKVKFICGLAGIGKTRLALEYAHKHSDRYSAVLFVSANSPNDLAANLAGLSDRSVLDLPEYGLGQEEEYASVIRWLQSKQNECWLLIIDNVDTDEAAIQVRRLISRFRYGHVIVTSRLTVWPDYESLSVLKGEDAADYLVSSATLNETDADANEQTAFKVAERLGFLPLALTHASAYIRYMNYSFDEYLKEYEVNFNQILNWNSEAMVEYDPASVKTIATTFFISYERLGVLEKTILRAAAYLASEFIPDVLVEQNLRLLRKLATLWTKETSDKIPEINVKVALADLAKYSLISRSNKGFFVHRMVRDVMRGQVPVGQAKKWFDTVQSFVYKYSPGLSESPKTWGEWDLLRPHVEEFVLLCTHHTSFRPNIKLMARLAAYYFGKGFYERSLEIERFALRFAIELNADKKDLAQRYLGLGESLRLFGNYKEAEEAFQNALRIRKEVDGDKSGEYAAVLNYLGLALGAQENEEEAIAIHRESINIYTALGEAADITDHAKSLNNLALLLKTDEVIPLLEKAAGLLENSTDQIKPQLSITVMCNLANALAKDGQIERSERFYKKSIEQSLLFPPEHFYRYSPLEAYSIMLRNAQRLKEARDIDRQKSLSMPDRTNDGGAHQARAGSVGRKLRICEAVLMVDTTGFRSDGTEPAGERPADNMQDDPPATGELALKGLIVEDSRLFQFSFIFDSGKEGSAEPLQGDEVNLLVNYFLQCLAVHEENQWANADGSMPEELRGSKMGEVLVEQSRQLAGLMQTYLSKYGLPPLSDTRHASNGGNGKQEVPGTLKIEIWLAPVNSEVYTGDFQGTEGDFAAKYGRGEARVFIVNNTLELFYECTFLHPAPGAGQDSIVEFVRESCLRVIIPAVKIA